MHVFVLRDGQTVYGAMKKEKAGIRRTLLDMARDNGLGFNQIAAANPGLDPWVPPEDAEVMLPTIFVLPTNYPTSGIVVNLAEMRLYYFFNGEDGSARFATCPVGVGREGYATELGVYTIYTKAENPVWTVPPSVRAEDPAMPLKVGPGPDNPLGKYILRFSRLSYGIHGTNRPWGVGRRVSHGCIRLYAEDIAALYPMVPVGTLVRIIYEPVKVGWAVGRCWLQVFRDFENRIADPLSEALACIALCEEKTGPVYLDLQKIKRMLELKSGIPRPVARVQESKN